MIGENMFDKNKNYAVIENGQLLMCGLAFKLGAPTRIVHDKDGLTWGRVYAIDEDGERSIDIETLNENDNNVTYEQTVEETTWDDVVEIISRSFIHDREPTEEVTRSEIADWEYNNELFKDVTNWVNEDLEAASKEEGGE